MIKLVDTNAKYPTRATTYSAGYDLYASEGKTIPPHSHALISTGITMTCPENTYARIAPRSGLALKFGIGVNAGVIDPDYTGKVGVILINYSNENFVVNVGDKIAQMIFTRFEPCRFLDDLSGEKKRGDGGFGSTGF